MNNALYHSMLENHFLKSNARKSDIQVWLTKKKIDFFLLETVAELRERVKVLIPTEKKYELDELALHMVTNISLSLQSNRNDMGTS